VADVRPLDGRVAIVTGAARGIGLAIARRLHGDGAAVVLSDLDDGALAKAADTLAGERVRTFAGDLSKEAAAVALIETALAAFGSLGVLVNNAGGGVIRPFLEHTPETLHRTIDRNLWTAIWCSRAALPPMLETGWGRIVNIGADSVRNGLWEHAAYNAAKGGVHGLTTGLAREFATRGVTVNTVAPPATNTEALVEYRERDEAAYEQILSVIPMGRPAEMHEVAAMVAFLASEDAAFVTGQVISVNGGSTML
jgi:2,3-dihydroxy-2,3-dihydro-p-cumate dehydrogenase